MSGTAQMARRKNSKQTAQPASGRRLVVQASEAWIAWVEEGADHCRTDVSKLTDVAIAFYLREQGFKKAPPRRVP